jgi:hypothetical protein
MDFHCHRDSSRYPLSDAQLLDDVGIEEENEG